MKNHVADTGVTYPEALDEALCYGWIDGQSRSSDAESWLGEAYPDLADDGVASVTLFEGDREVYGPMSLSA